MALFEIGEYGGEQIMKINARSVDPHDPRIPFWLDPYAPGRLERKAIRFHCSTAGGDRRVAEPLEFFVHSRQDIWLKKLGHSFIGQGHLEVGHVPTLLSAEVHDYRRSVLSAPSWRSPRHE